jgi:hypothetical protein
MGFFKNLFNKGESFVPTPTQQVAGVPPIVVQAIENLYPSKDDQKYAFNYVLQLKEKGRTYHNPEILLELLSYSNGKIENLLDVNSPLMGDYHFMEEMIVPIFPNMKAAEEWVKSITKPRV